MVNQILFLPSGDPLAARWGEESAATVEQVTAEAAGVDEVVSVDAMNGLVAQALGAGTTLYYVRGWPVTSLAGQDDPDTALLATIRRRSKRFDDGVEFHVGAG